MSFHEGFRTVAWRSSGNTGARRSTGTRIVLSLVVILATAAGPATAQTWAQQTSTTVENLNSVVYSTATTAAAVGATSVTIASGDGGTTWSDETVATLLGGDGSPDLNAVFSNGVTIVGVGDDQMGGSPEAIIASPDRGAAGSWVEIANVPGIDQNLGDGLFVSTTNAIAVDEDDGMGGGEILLSVDRGASWTQIAPAPFAARGLNAVDSQGSLVIAVGNNQGPTETIVRSVNLGVAWAAASSILDNNIDFFDVVVLSSTTAIAVGAGGVIIRSTDLGDIWYQQFTAADVLNAVDSSGDNLIAVGDNGTIVISSDAGDNWSLPTTNPAGLGDNLNAVLFLSGAIALAVGDGGIIVGTTNRGVDWFAQTSTTIQNLQAIDYNGVNNTLVVGATGTVLLSLDQITVSSPIPFRSKWPLVLLLVGAGLVALRRLRSAR